jgi:carboxypeptidase Q
VTASSRTASAILILLLIATVVAAAAQTGGIDADVARLTGRILADTPTMKDLREMTDGIGGRLTGTPACERAVDWAVAKFKAAGVDAVAAESFTLDNAWIPRLAEASCAAPVAFPVRVAAAPGTSGTPGGKAIEARIVDAGDGGAAAWAALGDTARGAIAIVRNPEMHTLDDLFAEYMNTPALLRGAKAAGVAAVLLQSSRPRGLLYRHPMSFAGEIVPTPVAIVSREQAERMLRLLEQGPVRARLALDNQFAHDVVSRNVVAEIRGSSAKDEIVLVGAHLDSFDLGTGANDNGVSCAEVIDLARQIKASGLTPRRTIRFVLFTAEEQGMIGSRAYVASHAAELDRHAAMVVYDIGSGRLTGIFLNGREDVRPVVDAALARVGSLGPFVNPIDAIDGTDNFDFLLSGIPNFVGLQDPAPYLPDYHAESDTFDKVDAREAKAGEAALASLVWELANAERLPPRQTRAEVEALIEATALEPQMKAFAQWDDWTSGRRGASKPPSTPR